MTEISKEYGTALFMLACEQQTAQEYAEALELLSTAFREDPPYLEFLASPSIPLSERLAAIEQAFSAFVPREIVSFLQLLCEKNRVPCFWGAVSEYRKLLEASAHISHARITSAIELTAAEREKLQGKLEDMCHSQVIMEYTLDETLIGGLVIEIDGKVLDGSLRHRLNEVKDVISR